MKILGTMLVFGMLASVAFAGNITGTVLYDGDAQRVRHSRLPKTSIVLTLSKARNPRHSLSQKVKASRTLLSMHASAAQK